MMGSTLQGEYQRSAEFFEQLVQTQGAYFALAFLIDSQYERKDLIKILEIMKTGREERQAIKDRAAMQRQNDAELLRAFEKEQDKAAARRRINARHHARRIKAGLELETTSAVF